MHLHERVRRAPRGLGIDKTNRPEHALAEMPKTPRSAPSTLRVIDVLAYPAVQVLDVTGPLQVFASANDLVAEAGGSPPYALRVVAQGRVTASAGLGLEAAALPPVRAALDTLIVAGGQGVEAAAADPALLNWVRKRASRARRVASVCTGAFLLAAAGVLDGRRAATHWSFCAELARRFPAVRVEPDPIFLCDGPVWTSAGVTAGIDLALALVEEDLGRSVALAVARYLVVFLKRPGGQAQFSAALSLQTAEDKFGALHDWINGHLASSLSLSVLADQAGMSERSLSRVFRQQTGMTVNAYVEASRIDFARRLLEDSDLPLKTIAALGGFGNTHAMRRAFLHRLGVTSTDYRSRFKSSRRSS